MVIFTISVNVLNSYKSVSYEEIMALYCYLFLSGIFFRSLFELFFGSGGFLAKGGVFNSRRATSSNGSACRCLGVFNLDRAMTAMLERSLRAGS